MKKQNPFIQLVHEKNSTLAYIFSRPLSIKIAKNAGQDVSCKMGKLMRRKKMQNTKIEKWPISAASVQAVCAHAHALLFDEKELIEEGKKTGSPDTIKRTTFVCVHTRMGNRNPMNQSHVGIRAPSIVTLHGQLAVWALVLPSALRPFVTTRARVPRPRGALKWSMEPIRKCSIWN